MDYSLREAAFPLAKSNMKSKIDGDFHILISDTKKIVKWDFTDKVNPEASCNRLALHNSPVLQVSNISTPISPLKALLTNHV